MKLKTEKTLHHEGLNEAQDDFNRSAALRSFAAQIEQRERQWEPDEFGVRFDSCPACGRHKRFSSDSHQVGFSTVQTWRCGYKRCGFLYFITWRRRRRAMGRIRGAP